MTPIGRRRGFRWGAEPEAPPEAEGPEEPVTRRSPGLAALFGGLRPDGRHSILDLGSAQGRQLRLLGRFGRKVRFAGVLPRTQDGKDWIDALHALPPNPDQPYDVVLLWDLLDRLPAAERGRIMERITGITAEGARLYVLVDASETKKRPPLAFAIEEVDRVSQLAMGPPEPTYGPILPAQLERTLSPFKVAHAFTLRGGLREYVARKETPEPQPPPE